MTLAHITERDGVLYVAEAGYKKGAHWRRLNGQWQMRGRSGKWFDCPIQYPEIQRQVADYENCLRSYSPDEGPEYPRANKKMQVGAFFRQLQQKELRAATNNIFAPVRTTYDASAENRARFSREYSYARLFRPGAYQDHLTT